MPVTLRSSSADAIFAYPLLPDGLGSDDLLQPDFFLLSTYDHWSLSGLKLGRESVCSRVACGTEDPDTEHCDVLQPLPYPTLPSSMWDDSCCLCLCGAHNISKSDAECKCGAKGFCGVVTHDLVRLQRITTEERRSWTPLQKAAHKSKLKQVIANAGAELAKGTKKSAIAAAVVPRQAHTVASEEAERAGRVPRGGRRRQHPYARPPGGGRVPDLEAAFQTFKLN